MQLVQQVHTQQTTVARLKPQFQRPLQTMHFKQHPAGIFDAGPPHFDTNRAKFLICLVQTLRRATPAGTVERWGWVS